MSFSPHQLVDQLINAGRLPGNITDRGLTLETCFVKALFFFFSFLHLEMMNGNDRWSEGMD